METFSVTDAFKALDDISDDKVYVKSATPVSVGANLNESVGKLHEQRGKGKDEVVAIAKFLKEAVDAMSKDNSLTMDQYYLDAQLTLAVYWSEGFDENDNSIIHSKNDPSYGLVYGIKIRNPSEWDGAFLDLPIGKDGDTLTDEESISPDMSDSDYYIAASWIINDYNELNSHRGDIANIEHEQEFESMKKKVLDRIHAGKLHEQRRQRNGILHSGHSIRESDKTDVTDRKAIQKADSDDKKDDGEDIEKVVDVDADTASELKKSYVGDIILQCPVCHTFIYKDESEIVHGDSSSDDKEDDDKSKTDDVELVNSGDECPHCGSKDGFKIIGKVAPLSADEKDDSEEDDSDADEHEDVDKPEEKESDKNESFTFQSVDDTRFDYLVERYLDNIYSNVSSYKTSHGYSSKDGKTVKLEGLITFNSGKTMKTSFILENCGNTKRGNVRLVGMNETFSKSRRAFQIIGKVSKDNFLSESFIYNYNVNRDHTSHRVYGRVLGRN